MPKEKEVTLSQQDVKDLIRNLGRMVLYGAEDLILHPGTSKPSLIRSVLMDMDRLFTNDMVELMEKYGPCFINVAVDHVERDDGTERKLLYLRDMYIPTGTPGFDILILLLSQSGVHVTVANDQIGSITYGRAGNKQFPVTRLILGPRSPGEGRDGRILNLREVV